MKDLLQALKEFYDNIDWKYKDCQCSHCKLARAYDKHKEEIEKILEGEDE